MRGTTTATETNAERLVKRYPIRNDVWMFHKDDGTFSVEDSTLAGQPGRGRLDPWNREMPSGMTAHRDRENDITHWTGVTTIKGEPIHLTVWND